MDCLQMKLPAEVSDTTLRKLGEMKLEISSTSQYGQVDLAYATTDRDVARIVGEDTTYFSNSDHTTNLGQDVTESGHIYIVNGDGGNLFIGGKQNITNMSLVTGVVLDLEEVKFCTELIWLYGQSGTLKGDIANLSEVANQMVRLDVRSTNNVYGSLDVFADSTTLSNITLERTNCNGSILNLQNSTSLGTLYTYGSTSIEGDPDDLADAMVANGRTSGTLVYTSPLNVRKTYTFTADGWTVT